MGKECGSNERSCFFGGVTERCVTSQKTAANLAILPMDRVSNLVLKALANRASDVKIVLARIHCHSPN